MAIFPVSCFGPSLPRFAAANWARGKLCVRWVARSDFQGNEIRIAHDGRRSGARDVDWRDAAGTLSSECKTKADREVRHVEE
jgi:hypothetical protein